jgi:hypothetical protein
MREIRKGAGPVHTIESDFFVLVLVLVLVNQYFIEDEHDDEGGN